MTTSRSEVGAGDRFLFTARNSLPQLIAGALARWYDLALRASKCSSISVALAAAISGSRPPHHRIRVGAGRRSERAM